MMAEKNKVLLEIHGRAIISWTLASFLEHPAIGPIVIAIAERDREIFERFEAVKSGRVSLVEGGEERKDSVGNALQALQAMGWEMEAPVLIHDAARCLVSESLLARAVKAAFEHKAFTTAIPIVDTMIRVQEGQQQEVSREGLYAIQTPQGFRFETILQAHQCYHGVATDDASMVRDVHPVALVDGCTRNIKVTRPVDLELARMLLKSEAS